MKKDRTNFIVKNDKTTGAIFPESVVYENKHKDLLQDLFLIRIGKQSSTADQITEVPKGLSEFTLHICLKGKGVLKVYDKRYILTVGDLFIIPPNVPHSYWANKQDPWVRCWMHFIGKQSESYCNALGIHLSNPIFQVPDLECIDEIWEKVFDCIDDGLKYENLLVTSLYCSQFLGKLFILKNRTSKPKDSNHAKIRSSMIFMRTHLRENHKVKALAEKVDMSPNYYRSLFKKVTTMSPIDYFTQLKMDKAKRLLIKKDLNIQEIARQVGYQDSFYFSRAFKKLTKMSPSKYRLENRGLFLN